jgi:hypothetical protein
VQSSLRLSSLLPFCTTVAGWRYRELSLPFADMSSTYLDSTSDTDLSDPPSNFDSMDIDIPAAGSMALITYITRKAVSCSVVSEDDTMTDDD